MITIGTIQGYGKKKYRNDTRRVLFSRLPFRTTRIPELAHFLLTGVAMALSGPLSIWVTNTSSFSHGSLEYEILRPR